MNNYRYTRSSRLGWPIWFVGLLAMGLSLALQLSASDYETAANTPKEVRQLINECLRSRDFEGAIPYLRRLLEMLGDSKRQDTRQSIEVIYYKLGIACFYAEDFPAAEQAFRAYKFKYPRGKYCMASDLYLKQIKRPQEKKVHLRRVLKFKPVVPEALMVRDMLRQEEKKSKKGKGRFVKSSSRSVSDIGTSSRR
jgi:tetratricopeptide (TPR) repeat protein